MTDQGWLVLVTMSSLIISIEGREVGVDGIFKYIYDCFYLFY